MSSLFEILVIVLLVLLNGVFAMSELALVSARPARLAVLERKGRRGARAARLLADDPQRFLPTLQVGISLVGVVAGAFGGVRLSAGLQARLEAVPQLAPFAEPLAFGVVVLGLTYITLVLGELVPKQLALRRPEAVAAVIARPILLFSRIGRPVVWVLSASSAAILRLLGLSSRAQTGVTEEELKALLAEGARAGVLESEEREMIERLLRLADRPVRAIMTPRTEIAWIDRTDSPREIAAALRAAPHSRFVVCEGSVDNVVGVVQAKDLLDRMLGGNELSVPAALRQPVIIPDTVTALDALERLKADPLGLALVMDEYGSFEGVVTASDVLQAIIGETWMAAVPDATPAGADGEGAPREWILDGSMPIDEVVDRLALPEEMPASGTYHTLGGLLLTLLKRPPRLADKIVFAGWRFEVMRMEGRRVDAVRAVREPIPE